MSNSRRGCITMAFCTVLGLGGSVHADPLASPGERPEYPVVLRISQEALDSRVGRPIDHQTEVDQMILGVAVTSDSRTTGNVAVKTLADHRAATFDVVFDGKTQTRNVGTRGPAIIYSRTETRFVCSRQVSFDPRQGYTASPTVLQSQTSLTFEGFDSTRPLLSPIVRLAARRRSQKLHEPARQIAARDNEEQLLEAFDAAFDERLADMNRRLDITRVVNALFGESTKLKLAACSSRECINLGIGRGEAATTHLTAVPPQRASMAPVELWVHPSMFGNEVAALIDVVSRSENGVASDAARLAILSAIPVSSGEGTNVVAGAFEGWFVIARRSDESSTAGPIRERLRGLLQ